MTLTPQNLTEVVRRGSITILPLTLSVEFLPNSYGHIGASKSPLSGKDLPIFKIDDRPVIPSTSLKGAWRSRLESILDERGQDLARRFGTQPEGLKPCIPTTAPSVAERDKFGKRRWLTGCQIEFEEGKVKLNPKHWDGSRNPVCPVCYFFGANGLQGFLRIGHLFPPSSAAIVFEQTITSRDRVADSVRKKALASSEHVKGGTRFEGVVEVLLFDGTFTFGDARLVHYEEQDQSGRRREINIVFDPWLQDFASRQPDNAQRQLALINELLIPAFKEIDILGGHRSKGGGKVKVSIEPVAGVPGS